jgi:hypothetical protein
MGQPFSSVASGRPLEGANVPDADVKPPLLTPQWPLEGFLDDAQNTSTGPMSIMEKMEKLLLPVLTPDNIERFRESCPIQAVTSGVMGTCGQCGCRRRLALR